MIVISEFMAEPAVAALSKEFETAYHPDLADKRAELRPLAARARALIVRNRTRVDRALLESAPRLECVGRLGVGLDNIDLEACAERGIAVYPATGANDRSVAEYVVLSAMALLRGAHFASSEVRAGEWPRSGCTGREIEGKRIGLVGFGSTGRRTAEVARALGMPAAAFDPHLNEDSDAWLQAERMGLEDLLAASDVVSLHLPLTAETKRMVSRDRIAGMKRGAVLVNAARGGVLDEAAAVDALREGRLGGLAIDVFEEEPVTKESGARFPDLPNLILTPHVAGVTEESNGRVSELVAEKVMAHLSDPAYFARPRTG